MTYSLTKRGSIEISFCTIPWEESDDRIDLKEEDYEGNFSWDWKKNLKVATIKKGLGMVLNMTKRMILVHMTKEAKQIPCTYCGSYNSTLVGYGELPWVEVVKHRDIRILLPKSKRSINGLASANMSHTTSRVTECQRYSKIQHKMSYIWCFHLPYILNGWSIL